MQYLTMLVFLCFALQVVGQFDSTGDSPQVIGPGIISSNQGEYSPTFDLNRNEIIFMRRTPGKFDYTLYSSSWDEELNQWVEPEILSISGAYRDAGPYLSPDGNILAFDSRRPDLSVKDNSINLWITRRSDSGWSEAELLSAPSANVAVEPSVGLDEFGPALDASGNLYFYSFRNPYRGGRRYYSEGPSYDKIRVDNDIPDPSAETFISYTYISPDGTWAILEGRAPGRRDTDLFFSEKRTDGVWTAPTLLPIVNTRFGEGGPYVSSDGQYLFFTSDRPVVADSLSNANLYVVRTDGLGIF